MGDPKGQLVSHHILSRAQAPGLANVIPGRNFDYGVPPPLRFLPYSWKASFIEERGVRGGQYYSYLPNSGCL